MDWFCRFDLRKSLHKLWEFWGDPVQFKGHYGPVTNQLLPLPPSLMNESCRVFSSLLSDWIIMLTSFSLSRSLPPVLTASLVLLAGDRVTDAAKVLSSFWTDPALYMELLRQHSSFVRLHHRFKMLTRWSQYVYINIFVCWCCFFSSWGEH